NELESEKKEGVYIYVRVSTGRQVLGTGLETQERDCCAYAERQGWVVWRVFREEGESAKTAMRTQLQKMLSMCRSADPRPSYVLIHALDRFARNGIDHDTLRAELLHLGIKVRCVMTPLGETPYDRFIERMLSGLPQLDNELRGERSLEGMKMRIQQGKWTFKAPIGYLNRRNEKGEKTLSRDPERAPLVTEALELFATGLYTKQHVRELISWKGLRSKNNAPISTETFSRMLRNPIYAGILTVEKWAISVQASFEPLVSTETFDRIQDLLQGRRNTITPRQRNRNEFPLRNFVRCGYCHKPLTGSPSTGKMGVKYLYYRCQNRGCPTPINVRTEVLHQHFVEVLRQQEPDKAFLAMFHKVVLHEWDGRQADAAGQVRGLERQIEKLKERKRKLLQAFIYDQTLNRSEYVEMRQPLDAELAFVEENVRLARAAEVEVDTVLDFAESLLLNIASAWERCTLDQKQRLQQVVFPRGVDYADGVYRTQQTSLLFKGLAPCVGGEKRFGSATGNRTRV